MGLGLGLRTVEVGVGVGVEVTLKELAHIDGDLRLEMVGEMHLELRGLAHHPEHLVRGQG